jgi:hypothetical protein
MALLAAPMPASLGASLSMLSLSAAIQQPASALLQPIHGFGQPGLTTATEDDALAPALTGDDGWCDDTDSDSDTQMLPPSFEGGDLPHYFQQGAAGPATAASAGPLAHGLHGMNLHMAAGGLTQHAPHAPVQLYSDDDDDSVPPLDPLSDLDLTKDALFVLVNCGSASAQYAETAEALLGAMTRHPTHFRVAAAAALLIIELLDALGPALPRAEELFEATLRSTSAFSRSLPLAVRALAGNSYRAQLKFWQAGCLSAAAVLRGGCAEALIADLTAAVDSPSLAASLAAALADCAQLHAAFCERAAAAGAFHALAAAIETDPGSQTLAAECVAAAAVLLERAPRACLPHALATATFTWTAAAAARHAACVRLCCDACDIMTTLAPHAAVASEAEQLGCAALLAMLEHWPNSDAVAAHAGPMLAWLSEGADGGGALASAGALRYITRALGRRTGAEAARPLLRAAGLLAAVTPPGDAFWSDAEGGAASLYAAGNLLAIAVTARRRQWGQRAAGLLEHETDLLLHALRERAPRLPAVVLRREAARLREQEAQLLAEQGPDVLKELQQLRRKLHALVTDLRAEECPPSFDELPLDD